MFARKIPLDYRRHLEMQVSDCLVTYIFTSTSTLLNPMRLSSKSFAGRVALFDNPSFLLFSLVSKCVLSRIRSLFLTRSAKRLNFGSRQTNTKTAPIEKTTFVGFCFFTHVILLNLTIKDRPVRIQQVDRHGLFNN